jgi:hypothetical protein
MASIFDKANMPGRDQPIFGSAPASPAPSFEKAAREQAVLQTRQAAATAPLQASDEAILGQAIPGAVAQVSQARQADRGQAFEAEMAARRQSESERQLQSREELFKRAMAIEEETQNNIKALTAIDAQVANEIFHSNLQFKKDELGRTLFNERQLADWAATKSRNQEELANYEQMSYHALEMRQQCLRVAQNRIQQALTQEFQKEQQARDQELMTLLQEAKAKLAEKQRKAQADAANKIGLWGAIGKITGGLTGLLIAGKEGAIAGASIGEGVGTIGAARGIDTEAVSRDRDEVFSPLRSRYNL